LKTNKAMKNLMFWFKYKTIKTKDNHCHDCFFYDKNCRNYIDVENNECDYKYYKERNYEQIVITVTAVICVVLLTIYLVLSSL